MRRVKIALTGLLAAACAVVSTSGSARVARAPAPHTAAQSQPESAASAVSEREEGRSLLRRGKAAAALVRLERALGLFRASGDRSGEASTQDLLGELYERQGRYEVARAHYAAALNIYAAPPKGGKPPKVPAPGAERANAAASAAVELAAQDASYNARLML
ncbi:MAG TPA: tetratricopeptide repeat protein, partial [Pyrinomonadaceae bacterium]|nr:tetratricopeptide repeat protein [Pyrinomonadaceae bacterium]